MESVWGHLSVINLLGKQAVASRGCWLTDGGLPLGPQLNGDEQGLPSSLLSHIRVGIPGLSQEAVGSPASAQGLLRQWLH